MKKAFLFFALVSSSLFISCEEDEERCEAGSPNITGAKCNDGTMSSATGSGACSSHGGVDYWICN